MDDKVFLIAKEVEDVISSRPEGRKILSEIRAGHFTEEEAVKRVMQLLSDCRYLLPDLARIANSPHGRAAVLDRSSRRPAVMKTSTGISQLNPLYESAIAERAFLDGDVPELRSGPLPEGARPAVPVNTRARDPVLIGVMLDQASEEVSVQIQKALEDHSVQCRQITERSKSEGTSIQISNLNLPVAPIGVPGYEPGKLPSLREVSEPSPEFLSMLPEESRQLYAYRSLATTQGRVSGAPIILEALVENLSRKYDIRAAEGESPPEALVTEIDWIISLVGKNEISDNFTPIQTAIEFLTYQLKLVLLDPDMSIIEFPKGFLDRAFELRVIPFNGISDRKFGWTAQLYLRRDL